MECPTNIHEETIRAALPLLAQLKSFEADCRGRHEKLDELIYEARAREHRKAARDARAAACYRIGAAFEPQGGLDVDPITLAGLDALGCAGLLLLVTIAGDDPHEPLSSLMRKLSASRIGEQVRAWGVWSRWNWLKNLYVAETETFLNSRKGRDPRQAWRREKPSAEQVYIVHELCILLQIDRQSFETRGAAFDWIRASGGNPRFLTEPERVDVRSLIAQLGAKPS